MNNTKESELKVELEALEITNDIHGANLHIYPYDPNFVDRSWSHDEDGNLHTYNVEVEFHWQTDEDYEGNTFMAIERIEVMEVKATDLNADPVVHTPQDHGRILRWVEENYGDIQEAFDKEWSD